VSYGAGLEALERKKKKKNFFNGTRNLACAARSNITYATQAISITEYFQKFYKVAKTKLRNEHKPHEIQPNEHGSFKKSRKLGPALVSAVMRSIREAQHSFSHY
jgi:hypothetical protein